MLQIDVANEQTALDFDAERLRSAVESVLLGGGVKHGNVSLAVVDDATIHQLNQRHLEHDYPTDVLSFLLDRAGDRIEGEIVVSADTAARDALRFGWRGEDELLLYFIHGALHLVGYDDVEPHLLAEMREQECRYLAEFGLQPRYDPTGD